MGIKKEQINKALDELENLATEEETTSKGDQGGKNAPLNSAEGDDMGVPRGKPMSNEAKKKKESHGNANTNPSKGGKAMKSFKNDLPEEVEEQIDVSDFLKSLVDHTGTKMNELTDHISKGEIAQESFNESLMAKFETVEKSQAMIGVVLKSVCEKLGIIENEAAHTPKSETSINKSETVTDRKFEEAKPDATTEIKKVEDDGEAMFKSLSKNPIVAKSQISDALCDLVKSGDALDTDVIQFEMNGYIAPSNVTKLKEKLN